MRTLSLVFCSLLAGCAAEDPVEPMDRPVDPPTSWRVVYRCDSGCFEGWRTQELTAMKLSIDGSVTLWRCGDESSAIETTLDDLDAEPTDVGLTWEWETGGAQFTAYAIDYPPCD